MSIAERPSLHERLVPPEHDYIRTGVILVLASLDYRGKVKVCMIKHKANPLKGISYGDYGFPSETLEKSREGEFGDEGFEDPVQALRRCFREELGLEDLKQQRLFADPEASFTHQFNLDTGLNGDSSNALGHGVVIWAPNQTDIIRTFQQAQSNGIIDATEVSGLGFHDVNEILNPGSSLQFRRAPHAPTIVTHLLQTGKLDPPRL